MPEPGHFFLVLNGWRPPYKVSACCLLVIFEGGSVDAIIAIYNYCCAGTLIDFVLILAIMDIELNDSDY